MLRKSNCSCTRTGGDSKNVGNHSIDHSDPDATGILAYMGLQQQLGLWAKWWFGSGCSDPRDFAVDG